MIEFNNNECFYENYNDGNVWTVDIILIEWEKPFSFQHFDFPPFFFFRNNLWSKNKKETRTRSKMRSILILLETIVILCVTKTATDATEETTITIENRRTLPSQTKNDDEHDTESARKIIGSR